MKRTVTICDVCGDEAHDRREMKHRWYDWGLNRTEVSVEHVCDRCWLLFLEWVTAGKQP